MSGSGTLKITKRQLGCCKDAYSQWDVKPKALIQS